MRVERSVTSISWIPSDAVAGAMKVPFSVGMAHWDEPLPEWIDDAVLASLRNNDRFRFANHLRAYVEVEDGRITGFGHAGDGMIGVTKLRLGPKEMVFRAVQFPTLRPEPETGDGWVRFVQTAGGRTGAPAPRPVPHPPFFQLRAPLAWTTLALTVHADGRAQFEVLGASPFPRHWVYDAEGKLAAKTGLIDYKDWARHAFADRTPWGAEDSSVIVTAVETALERELSMLIMSEQSKPRRIKVKPGKTIVEQGDEGDELFLLLDGLLTVEVDGETVAELGPGAILGERALLEGGRRTATLRAKTQCRLAAARGVDVDRDKLEKLAETRRQEDS